MKDGNDIVGGGLPGCDWISEHNGELIHIGHDLGLLHFCYGNELTPNIEQIWSLLKYLFRRIYATIPDDYFILFLREIE